MAQRYKTATGAANQYAAQISTNATTNVTAATAFISSVVIVVTAAGTTSTVSIKDKSGTPLTLIGLLPTTALSAGANVFTFAGAKMNGGIDIVTAGGAAATLSVFVNYNQ